MEHGDPEGGDVEMDFVGSLNLIEELGQMEPSFDDEISSLLLSQMGSVGKSCRREAQRSGKKLLSEIYSPPRVTELLRRARSRNLLPGCALDLTVVDPHRWHAMGFQLEAQARTSSTAHPRAAPIHAHRLAGVHQVLDVAVLELGTVERQTSCGESAHRG